MIIRNEHRHVSKNFLESEFFTKDPDFDFDGHFLDGRLIQAVQWLRDHFNVPIRINSSFRSHEYNLKIGGAKNSFHTKGMAVDISFLKDNREIIEIIEKEVRDNGTVRKALEDIGVKGILFYANFIHLDTRVNFYTRRYT